MSYNLDKDVRLSKYAETIGMNPEGQKKFVCPRCGRISFTPYLFKGEIIDAKECGRCDHEGSCQYHFPPGEYWQKYPERRPSKKMTVEERKELEKERELRLDLQRKAKQRRYLNQQLSIQKEDTEAKQEETEQEQEQAYRLPWEYVKYSEPKAFETPLYNYICRFVEPKRVREVFKLYHVGATKDNETIFWQIDRAGEVRSGHIMKFRENGHRAKKPDGGALGQDWIHSRLDKKGMLPKPWHLQQCLFGEHLLTLDDMPQPVCLVEAEKTAIIAACFMPQYIWIATCGLNNGLNYNKFVPLIEYAKIAGAVTVFADLKFREKWKEKLEPFRNVMPFTLSNFLEEHATPEAIEKGLDLADYLTGEF